MSLTAISWKIILKKAIVLQAIVRYIFVIPLVFNSAACRNKIRQNSLEFLLVTGLFILASQINDFDHCAPSMRRRCATDWVPHAQRPPAAAASTVFNRSNNHNCDLYDSLDVPLSPPHNPTIVATLTILAKARQTDWTTDRSIDRSDPIRGELLKRFAIYATLLPPLSAAVWSRHKLPLPTWTCGGYPVLQPT